MALANAKAFVACRMGSSDLRSRILEGSRTLVLNGPSTSEPTLEHGSNYASGPDLGLKRVTAGVAHAVVPQPHAANNQQR